MAHDAMICSSCGNLVTECSDPNIDWHPATKTCYATASQQWGIRRLRDKHKGHDPAANPHALHPLDGVALYVSRNAPENDPLA